MSLSVHVTGSAGTHPGPGRACSGYLVEAAPPDGHGRTTRLLLDCGNGSLANVQRVCDLGEIDAVLISHLHPDHFVDLFGLYYALRFHPGGPRQVPVYAPAGAEDLLRALLTAEATAHLPDVLGLRTVAAGDTLDVGSLRVALSAANHPVETVAARIEGGGRTIAYSGDSHVADDVVAAARDADLFICDASWLERMGPHPSGIHCTGVEAGRMAADAGAARLLVTHVVPSNNSAEVAAEAATSYDGDIGIAEDGLEIAL